MGLIASSALTNAIRSLSSEIRDAPDTDSYSQFIDPDAVSFIEANVYDPETGAPLVVYDEQRTVIDTMTHRTDGMFNYSTWLWSQPKKSGKTTICAGLALWWAWQIPNGQVYVIGNDQKQADSRLFRVIEYAVKHHPVMKDHARVVRYKIELSNGTVIEALPVDPTGEAGSNPTAIIYTEAWGFTGNKAELMWSEMALSPTRKGQSFILVESYAGHKGQSVILERLYNNVVDESNAIDPDHEIYAKPDDGIIAYWCTRRVMPWQNGPIADEYYRNERHHKLPSEYDRQHNNRWADSTNVFITQSQWDACLGEMPEAVESRRWVIGVDAAVSGDCFAIVATTYYEGKIYVPRVWVWYPPEDGKIDFREPDKLLRDLIEQRKTDTIVYDPYQLEKLMADLRRDNLAWIIEFSQGADRLKSDKRLRDSISQELLVHNGDPLLTEHVLNADAKVDKDETRLRIVKRQEKLKIDAAVALSMAAAIAERYQI